MFYEVLEKITAQDVHALAARGVPHTRVSEWRRRKRLPTRTQALALAQVTGVDYGRLEYDLAMIEAKKEAEQNVGMGASLLKHVAALYFSTLFGRRAALKR